MRSGMSTSSRNSVPAMANSVGKRSPAANFRAAAMNALRARAMMRAPEEWVLLRQLYSEPREPAA
jgi:hypothetical protein